MVFGLNILFVCFIKIRIVNTISLFSVYESKGAETNLTWFIELRTVNENRNIYNINNNNI